MQAKEGLSGAPSRHHTLPGKNPALDILIVKYFFSFLGCMQLINSTASFYLIIIIFVVTLQSSSGEKDVATMADRKANSRCKPTGCNCTHF